MFKKRLFQIIFQKILKLLKKTYLRNNQINLLVGKCLVEHNKFYILFFHY